MQRKGGFDVRENNVYYPERICCQINVLSRDSVLRLSGNVTMIFPTDLLPNFQNKMKPRDHELGPKFLFLRWKRSRSLVHLTLLDTVNHIRFFTYKDCVIQNVNIDLQIYRYAVIGKKLM